MPIFKKKEKRYLVSVIGMFAETEDIQPVIREYHIEVLTSNEKKAKKLAGKEIKENLDYKNFGDGERLKRILSLPNHLERFFIKVEKELKDNESLKDYDNINFIDSVFK